MLLLKGTFCVCIQAFPLRHSTLNPNPLQNNPGYAPDYGGTSFIYVLIVNNGVIVMFVFEKPQVIRRGIRLEILRQTRRLRLWSNLLLARMGVGGAKL